MVMTWTAKRVMRSKKFYPVLFLFLYVEFQFYLREGRSNMLICVCEESFNALETPFIVSSHARTMGQLLGMPR